MRPEARGSHRAADAARGDRTRWRVAALAPGGHGAGSAGERGTCNTIAATAPVVARSAPSSDGAGDELPAPVGRTRAPAARACDAGARTAASATALAAAGAAPAGTRSGWRHVSPLRLDESGRAPLLRHVRTEPRAGRGGADARADRSLAHRPRAAEVRRAGAGTAHPDPSADCAGARGGARGARGSADAAALSSLPRRERWGCAVLPVLRLVAG
jgi:hypothetical protein